jgi:hypothetical protein
MNVNSLNTFRKTVFRRDSLQCFQRVAIDPDVPYAKAAFREDMIAFALEITTRASELNDMFVAVGSDDPDDLFGEF